MADIKLQVYRGELGPEYVDFRGDGLQGSPVDEHRTVAEFRTHDEEVVAEILTAAPSVNRLLARFSAGQNSSFGNLASLVGLGGSGPVKAAVRIYGDD